AEVVRVELAVAVGLDAGGEAGAERHHDVLDLLVVEDLIEAGLFDVEDLAAQREDGLEVAVAGLLGRAAGGVALDEEDLALGGVLRGAVGELAGEAGPAEGVLALDE